MCRSRPPLGRIRHHVCSSSAGPTSASSRRRPAGARFVRRSRLPSRGKARTDTGGDQRLAAAAAARTGAQPMPRLLRLGGRRGNLSVSPRKTLCPPALPGCWPTLQFPRLRRSRIHITERANCQPNQRDAAVRTYVLDRPAARSRPLPPSNRAPSTLDGRGRRPRAAEPAAATTRCSSCISTSSGDHPRPSRPRGDGSCAISRRARRGCETSPR